MSKHARPYLLDILSRVEMIREFSTGGRDEFFSSRKTQESIIRCFEVIGEAVKRLPTELTEFDQSTPWSSYAGFRDVLIHQYEKVDLEVVWSAVEKDLAALETGVNKLLEMLDSSVD